MMTSVVKNKGKAGVLQVFSYLMFGVLFFSVFSWGDITGRIQSVDGKTVRIVLEGGMMPQVGARVKISDEVSGVGMVPLMGTWKVTAIEEDVVVAVTEDIESGTPLPGYMATISGEGGGAFEPPPDGEPTPEEEPTPVEAEPSPDVEHASVKVGGGGGGIAMPKTTWPFIVLAGLAVGIIILALTIGALRKAERGQRAKIRAALDVFYADGGRKTFIIDKERTTIGREEGNDLVLNDSGVSSHHAEISVSAKGFVLYDLESANGTFLNEKKISDALIYAGDNIRMGSTELLFRK